MMMTNDELRARAKQALRDMKNEVVTQRRASPLFRAYLRDGTEKKFGMPPGTEKLLNNGLGKEILFDYFRQTGAAEGVAAWIFGTDAWAAFGEAAHLVNFSEDNPGREAALLVTAQTATDVLILAQVYVQRPQLTWVGPPLERAMPQAEFGGRQKMFGAAREDITGLDPSRANAEDIGLAALRKL